MAMSFVFAPLMMILTAFGGTGNELLDLVDSKSYWKQSGIEMNADALIPFLKQDDGAGVDRAKLEGHVAELKSPDFNKRQQAMVALTKAGASARPVLENAAKSEDLQVAAAASKLLENLREANNVAGVHKLLAIRTLGELKAADALPHLEKLTESEELFVSEYAKRSIASIRGEAYNPPEAGPEAFEKDLAITYPSVAMIGHSITRARSGNVALRALLEQAQSMMKAMGAPMGPFEIDEMLAESTREISKLYQKIGNIRLDSITIAMPTGVSEDQGGFVITARGLYDSERVKAALKEEPIKEFNFEGIVWYGERDVLLHFASNELLVFVAGEKVEGYAKAVSLRLAGKDKSPAKGPALDLVEGVRDEAQTFLGFKMPETLKGSEEIFKMVDSIVASTRFTEDGALDLNVELKASDEETVDEMFPQMRMGLEMGKGAIEAMAKADENFADLKKMLASVRLERDGKTVTGNATLHSPEALPIGVMFMFLGAVRMDAGPPPPAIEAVPEVKEAVPELAPEPEVPEDAPAPPDGDLPGEIEESIELEIR